MSNNYDGIGSAVWGGLLLGFMFFTFLGMYKSYTQEVNMQKSEAICREAGGVPARIKPNVLCFAPEAFNGEPK
jgi:hypothetical protein